MLNFVSSVKRHRQVQARILSNSQRLFGSAAPMVHKKEKDYYAVLGVDASATPEQIKQAYYDMVKLHHPDTKAAAQPDADKFREVMEAYSVLSIDESRASYDISRRKNPDAYRDLSQDEFNRRFRADLRDAAGQVVQTKPARGSYAEQRLQELKEQR